MATTGDIVGPSNLVTFETVPEHWKKFTGELVEIQKEGEFSKSAPH